MPPHPPQKQGANNNNSGEISITLASPDETAKVRIAVANPDLVAEKVVSHLAKTFPPESVMTIAAAGDEATSTTTDAADLNTEDRSIMTSTTSEMPRRRSPKSPTQSRRSPVTPSTTAGTATYRQQQQHSSRASSPGRRKLVQPDRRIPSRQKKGASAVARVQEYFSPKQLDYAIPIMPDQSTVKLVNGNKIKIDDSRCFSIEYDFRGLPIRWIGMDGKSRDWAPSNHPGACIKFQDYVVHPDLVYAVPITPGQREVAVSDGGWLPIGPSDILTVFYDHLGRAGFSYDGGRKRIRPGCGSPPGGVATSVKYYMLVDCEDRSGEQFVIPVQGFQTEVVDPFKGSRTMPVDRDNITVVFYDKDKQPLYTQLADGSLLAGGLAGAPNSPDDTTASCFDESEFFCSTSHSGAPVPRVRLRGDRWELANYQPSYDGRYRHIPGVGGSRTPTPVKHRRGAYDDDYDDDNNNRHHRHYSSVGEPEDTTTTEERTSSEDDEPSSSSSSDDEDDDPRRRRGGRRRKQRKQQQPQNNARSRSRSRRRPNARPSAKEATPSEVPSMTSSKRQEIIERRVPVQQVKFVEKIVEVPEVHFVQKHVEVEKIEYETKIVKKKQIVERPVEHIKYVPKIETKIVERIIEIPEIIEVPRPEIIEKKVAVDRFVDRKEDVLVAHSLVPCIRDEIDGEREPVFQEVECLRVEPELIPVDVFVPKLVRQRLLATGKGESIRREVEVTLSHYNSLVLRMNPQYSNNYDKLPLMKTAKGSFPLLPAEAKITVPEPSDEEILQFLMATGLIGGVERPKLHHRAVIQAPR